MRRTVALVGERGVVEHGGASFAYQVVRSRRRKKTVQLTVNESSGVRVLAPSSMSALDIETFVRGRAGWIARKVLEVESRPEVAPRRFVDGETMPFLGEQLPLTIVQAAAGARRPEVRLDPSSFTVKAPPELAGDERTEAIRGAFVRWYREKAGRRLADSVARWAPVVGKQPARILVRDQKRRWGSCAPDGTLRFNWRTVAVEPDLLDYVVVHELAHLLVKDHSRDFWSVVERAMPDSHERRKRLREAAKHLSL